MAGDAKYASIRADWLANTTLRKGQEAWRRGNDGVRYRKANLGCQLINWCRTIVVVLFTQRIGQYDNIGETRTAGNTAGSFGRAAVMIVMSIVLRHAFDMLAMDERAVHIYR